MAILTSYIKIYGFLNTIKSIAPIVYSHDVLLLFYNVTNYYFSIHDNDGDETGENSIQTMS